jgi:Holliday junction resolvasome RuvABC endonuclease subunit
MRVRRIRRVVPERAPSPDQGCRPIVVVGIDPSITGTGVAVFVGDAVRYVWGWTDRAVLQKRSPGVLSFYAPPKSADRRHRLDRIERLVDWTMGRVRRAVELGEVHVAIEGYAFAGRGRNVHDIYEMVGCVKQRLWEADIPFRVYDPGSVKLAATGYGNADKGDMKLAAWQHFSLDFTKMGAAGGDLADAVLIGSLLRDELRLKRGDVLPKDLRSDVRKVLERTTKTQKDPLMSRPLIRRTGFVAAKVIFSDGTEPKA